MKKGNLVWKRTIGKKEFFYHSPCVPDRARKDDIGVHAWNDSMVAQGVNCYFCGRDIHKAPVVK